MQIRLIDRADGKEIAVLPIEQAVARIVDVLEIEADAARSLLLNGQAIRSVGVHYEITPEALASYNAAKLEAAYDNVHLQD